MDGARSSMDIRLIHGLIGYFIEAYSPPLMHSKQLRLIQLNVAKRKEIQWSLLNDEETANADILLIQEPHVFDSGDGIPSVSAHPKWKTHLYITNGTYLP